MDEGENIETNESFVELRQGQPSNGGGQTYGAYQSALEYSYTQSSQNNYTRPLGFSQLSVLQSSGGPRANQSNLPRMQQPNQRVQYPEIITTQQSNQENYMGERSQHSSRQNFQHRGQSSQGLRNNLRIDFVNQQQPTRQGGIQRSPPTYSSMSKLQTNLSDTQKMKANNPFRKDYTNIGVGGQTLTTLENERLFTTQFPTQPQTTRQGGVFDFTKSAFGFTQRLLNALTSPSPTAQGMRQNSPNTHMFNQMQDQSLQTSPQRLPGAFPSGPTIETRASKVSGPRSHRKRFGSPNNADIKNKTQPIEMIQKRKVPNQMVKNNIQRIIHNNIIENDYTKVKQKTTNTNTSIAPRISTQLEQETFMMKYDDLDTNRALQLNQQTTERLEFDQMQQRMMSSFLNKENIQVLDYQSVTPSENDNFNLPNGTNEQIKQYLQLLHSQSPFKSLEGKQPEIPQHKEEFSGANITQESDPLEQLDIELEQVYLDGNAPVKERQLTKNKSGSSLIDRNSLTVPKEKGEKLASVPEIHESTEQNEDSPLLDEKHKTFKLMQNEHISLGKKINQRLKIANQRKSMMKGSFVESSNPSSSFDSINPADLVLGTRTSNSNYASGVSNASGTVHKFSKLQPILQNGLYLQTRSSGYSSVYQVTRGDEDGNGTERSNTPANVILSKAESGIDKCLSSIDNNLNTFTTQQFEELRDKVKQMGYYKAQIIAQQQFGMKQPKTKIKDLTLSFISEDKKEESQVQEMQAELMSLNFAILNRKLVLKSEINPQNIICTGFLSCPSILFDPYSSKPQHIATILDHRTEPPSLGQYLPMKLLTIETLVSLKQKCEMISCGFEHCIALIDGRVLSWGYGGSGCLGHGDYNTVTQPKVIEGIRERVVFVEAGGYHNGVIAQSSLQDKTKVFVWGRGDVGQLGINQKHLVQDAMGQVKIVPHFVTELDQVVQLALGDAHSLFLTRHGNVMSCGWHDLGQLGVSNEQREQNSKSGIFIHQVKVTEEITGEPVKIKQITCGAVFSIALAFNGDIYAWGSNNNGQMAMTTTNSSQSSLNHTISEKQVQSQQNTPTKIEIERDVSGGMIKQILAGDCHVFAIDESNIYAWGQGQIIDQDSKNEKFFQDVICNQPILIEQNTENEMTYTIENNDAWISELQLPLSKQQKKEKAEKRPAVVPPLALGAILQPNEQQPTQNQINKVSQKPKPVGKPLHESSHKTIKSKVLSNDYDLETLKNTDDYNNFMKNGSDMKKMDNESFNRFAQRLNLNYRDSSIDGSRKGLGTTGRDNTPGGMSDLMTVMEDNQFRDVKLNQTQKMNKEKASELIKKLKDSQNDQAYFTSNVQQQYPLVPKLNFDKLGQGSQARQTQGPHQKNSISEFTESHNNNNQSQWPGDFGNMLQKDMGVVSQVTEAASARRVPQYQTNIENNKKKVPVTTLNYSSSGQKPYHTGQMQDTTFNPTTSGMSQQSELAQNAVISASIDLYEEDKNQQEEDMLGQPLSIKHNKSQSCNPGKIMIENVEGSHEGSSGHAQTMKYSQNVISGGTGETGRNQHMDQQQTKSRQTSTASSNLLSLKNKVSKVSRHQTPERQEIRHELAVYTNREQQAEPYILTNDRDEPVAMSSRVRASSSVRSRSPQSPNRTQQSIKDNSKAAQNKNPIPKAISSKQYEQLEHHYNRMDHLKNNQEMQNQFQNSN